MGKVWFPLMKEDYLLSRVVAMAPAKETEWMAGKMAKVLLALAACAAGAYFESQLLRPKELDHWPQRAHAKRPDMLFQ